MTNHCEHHFTHPLRPRDRCNLPGRTDGFCIFHNQSTEDLDVRSFISTLTEELKKRDHWLEGITISADISNLNLSQAKMPRADFSERRLVNVTLSDALLEEANFINSQLSGVIFVRSNLRRTHFERATLNRIDFREADLGGIFLIGSAIREPKLSGLTLSLSTNVGPLLSVESQEMLNGWWNEAGSIVSSLGKRAAEDWDFVNAERAAYLAMTCSHWMSINPAPHSRPTTLNSWILPTIKAGPRGLLWMLHRLIWGYGLLPSRVFVAMMLVVSIFAFAVFPFVEFAFNGKQQ